MKYTILVYENAADFSARTDAKRKDAYWGAYRAYTKALTTKGCCCAPPRPAHESDRPRRSLKPEARRSASPRSTRSRPTRSRYDAEQTYARAIGLSEDSAVRDFLAAESNS